jgi:hypothetical protein
MKTIHNINTCTLKTCISKNNSGVKFVLSSLKKFISVALFFILSLLPEFGFAKAASYNPTTQIGKFGTTYSCIVYSGGTTDIHENTISNLNNNTMNSAVGTRGLINGKHVKSGTNTITKNRLSDISIANASISTWIPSAISIFLEDKNGFPIVFAVLYKCCSNLELKNKS